MFEGTCADQPKHEPYVLVRFTSKHPLDCGASTTVTLKTEFMKHVISYVCFLRITKRRSGHPHMCSEAVETLSQQCCSCARASTIHCPAKILGMLPSVSCGLPLTSSAVDCAADAERQLRRQLNPQSRQMPRHSPKERGCIAIATCRDHIR